MEKILVYGTGKFYEQNKENLKARYNIAAFIDTYKEGTIDDIPIIRPQEIGKYQVETVYIMIQNVEFLFQVIKILRMNNISNKKIICPYFEKNECIDCNQQMEIHILENLSVEVEFESIKIGVNSVDEYYNVYEVLVNKVYLYHINNDKRDIVIDIGMNIGDATLFFLNQKKTKKVYGYEPFKQTYLSARENLKEYLFDKNRVEIFQFGISDKNELREIEYNPEMSCGQSTLESVTENARHSYENMGLISKDNDVLETIEVRKASEVLEPIIKEYSQDNLVLKMDCEGDEYGIMEELLRQNLLHKFNFIMLEWHYKGKEILLEYLREAGFSYWCNDKNADMGLVYAYNMER